MRNYTPQQRLGIARRTLIREYLEGNYENQKKAERYYRQLSDRFNKPVDEDFIKEFNGERNGLR